MASPLDEDFDSDCDPDDEDEPETYEVADVPNPDLWMDDIHLDPMV